MSLFRRHIITVTRVSEPLEGGKIDPEYFNGQDDIVVYSGLKADIQYKAMTSQASAKLPLDTAQGVDTEVFFKAPYGTIKNRDFITDEIGRRYQVFYAYYTIFGYQCYCKKEDL